MTISFPNLSQGPAHCFFDKISLIRRVLFDQGKKLQECLIGGLFVMNCQLGHHDETSASDKLRLPVTPFYSLLIGMRGSVEQIATYLVAHIPCIKIINPLVHLPRRNKTRICNH